MKIYNHVVLATALLASVLSCKKQDQPAKPNHSENLTVATAKNFFESQVKKIGARSERTTLPFGEPNWDSAYDKRLNIGDAIAVPLKMESYSQWGSEKVKGDDYLMVYKIKDGSLRHEVVTVIPRTSHEYAPTFNGMVIIRDWSGSILRGFNYKSGSYEPAAVTIGSKRTAATEKEAPCQEPSVTVCIRWADGMGIDCTVGVPVSGCGTGGGDFPGGGGSWGGGPGGGNPDPGNYPSPGGGGNGSGSNTGGNFRQLTNLTTSPCISSTVQNIINSGYKGIIAKMLYHQFGANNSQYSIEFTEQVRSDNNLGVHAVIRSDLFEINLNTRLLQNATKELIASTILHETMHAIFTIRKMNDNSFTHLSYNEWFQHQMMATAYIDDMSNGLREMFPNLPLEDAKALSWEGLQKTQAWTDLLAKNPSEANDIALKGDEYEAGHTKGTRCN